MNECINNEIVQDRMWSSAKKFRQDIADVADKLKREERMTDYDMKIVKYAVSLTSQELLQRRVSDLEEQVKLEEFGVDTSPAE